MLRAGIGCVVTGGSDSGRLLRGYHVAYPDHVSQCVHMCLTNVARRVGNVKKVTRLVGEYARRPAFWVPSAIVSTVALFRCFSLCFHSYQRFHGAPDAHIIWVFFHWPQAWMESFSTEYCVR